MRLLLTERLLVGSFLQLQLLLGGLPFRALPPLLPGQRPCPPAAQVRQHALLQQALLQLPAPRPNSAQYYSKYGGYYLRV